MTSLPRRCGRILFLVCTLAAAGMLVPPAGAQPSGTGAAGAASQPTPGSSAGSASKPATAAKPTAAGKPSPASAASYSLGVSMGEQLRANGIPADAVSSERLAQGVRDALSGKVKLTDADRNNIAGLVRAAREAAGDAGHRAAAKFLAENGKKPDVVTTASGLQYRVVAPGKGDSPKATDEVIVNYRGKLLDGTEFDSSYARGKPVTFPVNHVIPGWTEALQLMKPGGKYELFVPPQLAYDLNPPAGAPIPPGSMLIFDVELVGIKPPQTAAEAPK
ncbi:MAG TPA: FKBP-type peptidyl-prolyl cis-trans isomerase [Steroidobacteraceae bacterium]|nr:FKBP-type peptidyl-prolyl cis-trans isomerase [Steroidobacteraceae bacterium]